MEGKTFRLGEYLITDFGSGLIGWEAHHDFGGQRSGRCHQWGEVLVLGEFEEEKTGYLKGEFLDRLKTLPPWDHSRYFCQSSQLQAVGAGRALDNNLLKKIGARGIQRKVASGRTGTDEAGPFRLGRYRITAVSDREFVWETWGDGKTIVKGNCSLESGILLLGPPQGPTREQNKREFIQHLRRLPRWQETLIWCRHNVLQPSQAPIKLKIPWSLQRLQIPKRRLKKTGVVEKFVTDKRAEKPKRSRFKNWRPSLLDFMRSWKPSWPSFSRVRSSLVPGFKLPLPSRIFSRWSQPKKPENPPRSGKAKEKSWVIWASFIFIGLLLALLLTTLYVVLKNTHNQYHVWKHFHKSKDH
jgi:hypothetical protein